MAAKKSDQGHVQLAGETDGQTRRRGDGGDDRNAGDGGLLEDLESAAATDHENAIGEREAASKEGPASEFVHSIVATDVFALDDELALGGEQSSGMQPAGTFEDGLAGAQRFGEAAESGGADAKSGIRRSNAAKAHGVDGGFPADAAARCGVEVAVKAIEGGERGRIEIHADDIAVLGGLAVGSRFDVQDLLAALDEAFGQEEARGKLQIVAGCAHRDAEGAIASADFERFFAGEVILEGTQAAVLPFLDHGEIDAAE